MTAVRAKAPTLTWLLTALTCLLVGMAIVESRHQAVALPALAPVGVVVTVEPADPPTLTPVPTPPPIRGPGERLAPQTMPLVEDVPVRLAAGHGLLRVARLTVPPGVALPPEVAAGPTVLLVESGTLSVLIDNAVLVELGLESAQIDAALSARERLVIAPGARYTVRNDGVTPAVVLVVTITPPETATPMLGPGEPPLP